MSRPQRQLEDALGIEPDDEKIKDPQAEAEAEEEALQKRLAKVKAAKEEMKKRQDEGDKDFIKETLREIAMIGVGAMHVMQDEIEVNGKGRDVECLAGLMNSTRDALKELQDVELDEQKMDLEKEKVEMRKNAGGNTAGRVTQNNLFVGTQEDMIKMVREAQKMTEKIADADIIEKGDEE